MLQVIIMLYTVIYAINGSISLAITSRYCYRKLQKDSTPWYCKNCLKQVLPYNKLTDYQLKALMLGKVLTSPKLLSTNDYLLFPDEECENAVKTELMTPDDFYQINNIILMI